MENQVETDEYPLGESPEYQAQKRAEVEAAFGTPVPENPIPSAPEPPKQKYAMSDSWSRSRDYKVPFDHVLSGSGQEIKVRRLDMGDLLKLGIAEEMDFMTKALMESNEKKAGGEAVASAVMKAGNFERMDGMINKVVLAGLLAPKPHHPPMKHEVDEQGNSTGNLIVDDDAKKPGVLYVDDIPFADRMEMFSIIFESDGLATFRSEQTAGVGDVETVSSVSLPTD